MCCTSVACELATMTLSIASESLLWITFSSVTVIILLFDDLIRVASLNVFLSSSNSL